MTDPSSYKLNHTMLRVKDPQKSIEFYEFLGLKQVYSLKNDAAKFTLYMLAYDGPNAASHNKNWTDREGVIELTHNHGSEDDPNFAVTSGNSDPGKGFGHVCIGVDNIQAACSRIENAGYKFQKKLTDGNMNHIAFALDPDGYWVEIVSPRNLEKTASITTTDVGTYRMNHTMLRVKDKDVSLKFYQEVMGMKHIFSLPMEQMGFNLYFLGYGKDDPPPTETITTPMLNREGLLELTWNYGTEKDDDFKYHSGNEDPKGFGHIGITVDDLDAACERLEEKGVTFKKKLTDGQMKDIAFVLDPDGYWIELLQNEGLKKRVDWEKLSS